MKVLFRLYQIDTHAHIKIKITRHEPWGDSWVPAGDLCVRAEELHMLFDVFKGVEWAAVNPEWLRRLQRS